MSDQFTGFHYIVIPGTLKEALFVLDGLLDQQSPIQPTEVMTDTNSYTDIVFGLFWLLGFQFSHDWLTSKIDVSGVWNGIQIMACLMTFLGTKSVPNASFPIGMICFVLLDHSKQEMFNPHISYRIFSTSSGSTSLAKSIRDVGRIAKTLYMLHYLRDESYRRRILTQLNHTELRHKLARHLCYGNRGELKQSYKEGQEEQLGALGLLLNLVVYWNTYYLDLALTDLLDVQPEINHDELTHITPLAYESHSCSRSIHIFTESLCSTGQSTSN